MRIDRPASLRIDRETLLADVRDRLEARLPPWATELVGDPTDPGWMLLEEAAWMVEALSEQLDQYPYAVLQQLVYLIGGELLPAVPAVGAVALATGSPGVLRDGGRPGELRLLSAQTEERDAIAFVLAEPAVPLRPGVVASLVEFQQGSILRAGAPWGEGEIAPLVLRRAEPVPSAALAGERVVYRLVSANAERTLAAAMDAVKRLSEEGPGWLRLSAEHEGEGAVRITAVVDPAAAFDASAPTGLSPGGDLEGRWGSLEDLRWTPPIRVADDPLLPLALRGSQPLPGLIEGALVIPGVPPNLSVASLLERRPVPVPAAVREGLWAALARRNLDLAALRPLIRHEVGPADQPGEPRWLEAALAGSTYEHIAAQARSVAEIRLPTSARGAGRLRFAVASEATLDPLAGLEILGLEPGGALGALQPTLIWRLPVHASATRIDELSALEVELSEAHDGLLIVSQRPIQAVILNPAMVINAPVIEDGRRVHIDRTVPEAVSLRAEDVVGPGVRERLLSSPLPPEARALLTRLPLARMVLDAGEQIRDFSGVELDPTAGRVVLNAPDATGELLRLRRGQALTLAWYRRTDGAAGNLDAGEIAIVEQRAADRPRILAVSNPIPTGQGVDRESEEAAMDRLFGAPTELPVLAGDWERLLRQTLSTRARGWILRCWTYAERTLVSHALWPLGDGTQDSETLQLRRALAGAGPETLLVVLGPSDGLLSDADLAWARQVIEAVLRRTRERLPTLRRALVTRLWPLSLEGAATAPQTPCWDAEELEGTLVDPRGRRALPPARGLLLNAAVVRTAAPEGWGS